MFAVSPHWISPATPARLYNENATKSANLAHIQVTLYGTGTSTIQVHLFSYTRYRLFVSHQSGTATESVYGKATFLFLFFLMTVKLNFHFLSFSFHYPFHRYSRRQYTADTYTSDLEKLQLAYGVPRNMPSHQAANTYAHTLFVYRGFGSFTREQMKYTATKMVSSSFCSFFPSSSFEGVERQEFLLT